MPTPRSHSYLITLITIGSLCATGWAQQRVRIPSTVPGLNPLPYTASAGPSAPVPGAPAATLGPTIQPFDPYSATGGALPGALTPGIPTGPPVAIPMIPVVGAPAVGGPAAASIPPTLQMLPMPTAAGSLPPAYTPIQPPPFGGMGAPGQTAAPAPAAPVFPNGINWAGVDGQYQRLFQDTGLVYTYLSGSADTNSMGVNEFDISTTMVFNNFAHSADGLRITPGFTFDLLNGPSVPDQIVAVPPPNSDYGADLPGAVYAVYVQGAWAPRLTPQFTADLRLRVGAYTDFQTVTNDSLRFTGHGLGVLQLTPTMAFKLGIEYLDRLDIKLFPAFGLTWMPDARSRYDIYFPRPKFARYWRTIGNTDVWWHIGGEYGGGSWTYNRVDDPLKDASDRFDYNDIRLFGGFDWTRLNRQHGFIQMGWVFNRELVMELEPTESQELNDSFMVRAGVWF